MMRCSSKSAGKLYNQTRVQVIEWIGGLCVPRRNSWRRFRENRERNRIERPQFTILWARWWHTQNGALCPVSWGSLK